MEANNAKIEYFSPLNDENLPDVDALYIGGGYPELFSKQLSANENMLKEIKDFHLESRPIFAECGGLMYLMNSIHEDKVVNVYPYKAILTDRVQALKYTIAEVTQDNIISKKGEKFHGHEFHYSKVEYKNNKTKVCIICPIHGEFWQRPNDHLNGYGCNKCGIIKTNLKNSSKLNDFITKVKKIHNK